MDCSGKRFYASDTLNVVIRDKKLLRHIIGDPKQFIYLGMKDTCINQIIITRSWHTLSF